MHLVIVWKTYYISLTDDNKNIYKYKYSSHGISTYIPGQFHSCVQYQFVSTPEQSRWKIILDSVVPCGRTAVISDWCLHYVYVRSCPVVELRWYLTDVYIMFMSDQMKFGVLNLYVPTE